MIEFELDGRGVGVEDGQRPLLDTLREVLGVRSVKDGCSPQGQCGCCTVLVDGAPRVACVTPTSRIAGRRITTIEGLDDAAGWAARFCVEGATQCGFCTPGIIVRLASLSDEARAERSAVDKALLAHLCRCTGWQSIVDAAVAGPLSEVAESAGRRDRGAAETRAALEGGSPQQVSPEVALGGGGFADDTAPPDASVAVRSADGSWIVGATLAEARRAAGKVQGRRTSAPAAWPVDVPEGTWAHTLRTTWVEPAYLEPDAAWCAPGGDPVGPLANGGAFGGKVSSQVGATARRLADQHGRVVRVLYSREDTVAFGPKRPPLAVGIDASGGGIAQVVRPADEAECAALAAAAAMVAPDVDVRFVEVPGPPASGAVRAALWAELAALRCTVAPPAGTIAGVGPADSIIAPNGAEASATIVGTGPGAGLSAGSSETVHVQVRCGRALDDVVLRSYCVGAAHMALGMVRSEFLAVGDDGAPLDLTIRSFGVLRAVDTPRVEVAIVPDDGPPVNGSDAVFAAVLAAAHRSAGTPDRWPLAAM